MAQQEGYVRWLKDNSIAAAVEVALVDGTRMLGVLRVPRDRTLRELMNGGDSFVEIECRENGAMVVAKASILSLRPFRLPPAEQLTKRLEFIEQIGAEKALGLTRPVTRAELKPIFSRLAQLYHPDSYPRGKYPDEICDFVTSMARRLYLAYLEVDGLLEAREVEAEQQVSGEANLPAVRVA